MDSIARRRLRVAVMAVVCVALAAALSISTVPTRADVDKDFEYKNKNRNLTICLESSAGCPAGMADSVKAAVELWKKKLVSWKLKYDNNCTNANVKVNCGKLKGLGQWSSSGGSYGASTGSSVTINKDADWGWCNDKHELVDALVHEIGHALRLNDINNPANSMHRSRGKTGHKRGPSAGDSTEAATSDTTGVVQVDENPPGGKKLDVYTGIITPRPDQASFNLSAAIGVVVEAYRPYAVTTLGAFPMGDNAIQWDAEIHLEADHSEAYWVTVIYPDTELVWDGILKVAPDFWDPGSEPFVVAPPDTTVFANEEIILYNTLCAHPMGPEWMSYRWEIDGQWMMKGYDTTSVVLPVGAHTIVLRAEDEMGKQGTDTCHVFVEPSTGVDDSPQGLNYLDTNYPNPFNPTTTIRFGVAQRGRVTLRIYDVHGALVRTLVDGVRSANTEHRVQWNGSDDGGQPVASGVYFLRLDTPGFHQTRKMVLLR